MIPVVFIHFGECSYAPAVLDQARVRGNEVVFLNQHGHDLLLHPFAQHYEHLSGNHRFFELACMVRWFVLRDWMLSTHLPDCLYCDTDVLLFTNVDHVWHSDPYYSEKDFTLSLGTSGHTSFWTFHALDQFCEFLMRTYRDRDDNFNECERIFGEMRAKYLAGGVSDMLLLNMFARQSGKRVGEMSIPREATIWDHNINSADGFKVAGDGVKAILFTDSDPYGRYGIGEVPVRFQSLHMQGQAKQLIQRYLR